MRWVPRFYYPLLLLDPPCCPCPPRPPRMRLDDELVLDLLSRAADASSTVFEDELRVAFD